MRYRVCDGSESLVGTDRLLISSTGPPHSFVARDAPSDHSGDFFTGEGCRPHGEGRRAVERERQTVNPAQPASSRSVSWEARGPNSSHRSGACWARHRFPPRVPLYVCMLSRVAQGAPSLVSARGRGPFRAHLHERRMGISMLPLLLRLLLLCPLPFAKNTGGKKELSTRHDARPARGRPAQSALILARCSSSSCFASRFSASLSQRTIVAKDSGCRLIISAGSTDEIYNVYDFPSPISATTLHERNAYLRTNISNCQLAALFLPSTPMNKTYRGSISPERNL